MEKGVLHLLVFNAAVVIITLTVFLYGPMGNSHFFLISSWVIFSLLLLAASFTLYHILRRRGWDRMTMLFLSMLALGFVLSFFNWFIGGVIALIALLFLFLSPRTLGDWEILVSYGGFAYLALLPPLETYLGIFPSFWDYIVIAAGIVIILLGVFLARRKLEFELMLGFIFLSLSFLILAPFHELFGIHNNGVFGIYDASIIILAVITFFIFLFSLLEYDIKWMEMQEKIRKGYIYIGKGEYKKAEGLFRILYKRSKDEEILNGLAIALMRGGKLNEAEKILQALVRRYPNEIYLTNLGNLYYRRGNLQAAMLLYGKVLKKNPDSYNALNNLALCYMDLGEEDKARKLLERAMKIKPKSGVAEMNYRKLLKKAKS